MADAQHPMQPLVMSEQGVIRFKQNAAVRKLLDFSTAHGFGLNHLACTADIPREDHVQLAQLIGYSLDGFGDLGYVTNEDYARAEVGAAALIPERSETSPFLVSYGRLVELAFIHRLAQSHDKTISPELEAFARAVIRAALDAQEVTNG